MSFRMGVCRSFPDGYLGHLPEGNWWLPPRQSKVAMSKRQKLYQGRPFRSVPGARISVRSGPFRSAAFHVVSESAYKDATCVFCESGNASGSCRWPMSEIFCKHYYRMEREVTQQFLAAFWEIQEMQVGFNIGQLLAEVRCKLNFAFSGLL